MYSLNTQDKTRFENFLNGLNDLCKKFEVSLDNAEFLDRGNFIGNLERNYDSIEIVSDDIPLVTVETKNK
jgi:hypothetical protein